MLVLVRLPFLGCGDAAAASPQMLFQGCDFFVSVSLHHPSVTLCTVFCPFIGFISSFSVSDCGLSAIRVPFTTYFSDALNMILRSLRRTLLLSLLTTFPWLSPAKKDNPTITSTKLESPLDNIFYFENSNVILGHSRDTLTVWRSDNAGADWKKVNGDDQAGHAWDLWPHPFDNQRAYMLGISEDHWITTDQGKTWKPFKTLSAPSVFRAPLAFHGRDPKKIIWNGEKCIGGIACEESVAYTNNDFEDVTRMGIGTRGCRWAVSTPEFGEDIDTVIEDRIFCVVQGLYSTSVKDNRLVVSDDYFDRQEVEPALDSGRAVTGIINMAPVKKYMVAAAKAEGTNELALYVTDDSSQWHRAEFGQHKVEEDAYTILEGTNYSMQVDVLGSRPTNPMGYLFTSNSNGTYFTRNIDHTNRNLFGHVDFEKVAGIQGIVLVNVVDNWEAVEGSTIVDKNIISRISFDDGRTFQDLRADGKTLHLHSVTDARSGGRIFSSPAPGIVMGVGNTGKYLKPYDEGDLYVSDDAGLTWTFALEGAHKYEFGNEGAVLMAVDDEEETGHIWYSIDHGKNWIKANLGMKIRARFLTTEPGSSTLNFLLMGTSGKGSNMEWHILKIDFEGLHERMCGKSDFEDWYARVDKDGKPTCLMGHKQSFRRRKADAGCFLEQFMTPKPTFEPCKCTSDDFECDFNFMRNEDRSKCIPAGPLNVPSDVCKAGDKTFKGPSGWRLIPGNDCIREKGVNLDKEIERDCTDTVKKPASGEVAAEKTIFKADKFSEWSYLERADTSQGDDETLIMRTTEQELYVTRDHGKTWEPILKNEPITSIQRHPHLNDVVFFLTGSRKVFYSIDRAKKFGHFEAPAPPSTLRIPTLHFHPTNKEWLLWAGSSDGHTNVWYSKDRGDHWDTLARYAKKCEFLYHEDGRDTSKELIYCEQYKDENVENPLQLVSSDDWFAEPTVHFPDILDFATMAEFIIVAAKNEDATGLKVDASVDGRVFAPAEFPKNFQVEHQQAYTVLDSSTHAVFLHVTVNANRDREYGSIIKSNSNGTSYVLTKTEVNRDTDGYVDFEKMLGLEGVAMVNVVSNPTEVEAGANKKLKSMITHNDGAEWGLLPPPKKDAIGKEYPCAGGKCTLHIHSYTERSDKGATFSSPSGVGLMMAVGNVGEYLLSKNDEATDTFITRDAGISWQSVKKGSYLWEYGDQGSIIVIVPESTPTKVAFYSLDEGKTWKEFEFSPDIEMQIDSITTVPSDNSLNFLLWGREIGSRAKKGVATVNLDFTGLEARQRKCEIDEQNPEKSKDYVLWEPRHPMQDDNCLFGHVAQYHRKKPEADCYNGKLIHRLHDIDRNCSCTRRDFEW